MAISTFEKLHHSLTCCPTENDLVERVDGLKNVALQLHQKRALAWLLWREKQDPSGGLLADDMGLGKTLTMIALVIKSLKLEPDGGIKNQFQNGKYYGGTLVVCPASLINQWSNEVQKRTRKNVLATAVYHGTTREIKPKRLASYDMVISTYGTVRSESQNNGVIFRIKWHRIILDEAHQIRNNENSTFDAIYKLSSKSRWAMTGTPIHNNELDMYSILKFLRCSPFDDPKVWKKWFNDKSAEGQNRLRIFVSSLMLRRTKDELMEKGILRSLPVKKFELVLIKLDKHEMDAYKKFLATSTTLFNQFVQQNGKKVKPNIPKTKKPTQTTMDENNILVQLLRLRQLCCHPFLVKKVNEKPKTTNLLEQMNKLTIKNEDLDSVFSENRQSSKIKILLKMLKEKIVSQNDKAIVVSQWTSFLQLIAIHLKKNTIKFDNLDGSIAIKERANIVDKFNDPKCDTKVLLLSLTAGGVGLNLSGANHLFLMDLHWNPQMEKQAQDRIYRIGQTKPVFIYKFMAVGTIEERIKAIQEEKLKLAGSILSEPDKLTIQDLKLLFNFK
ncbi:SNF2 N, Helicase C, and/or DEAD domain containing protein [Asbolus verrucosus]|uniref:SNF2 N, Helicase C, and/or DEAD domain containing protein n=1 Tax=Asbolus verrucosus TaxID=1661398 RepID=A0A482VIV0_ASBVE|nr:SNF2 N, Helicase C, and/or DEAD domain containing protein [Asbolus verrucosus]